MSGPHTTPLATESVFREHQKKVFDGLAEYFATGQTVPTALVPVYQYLARYILSSAMLQKNTKKRGPENEVVDDGDDNGVTVLRILDVACGAGVLWPYLAAVASQGGVQLQVTGVDLSPHMVQAAAATAATLVDASAPIRHTFAAIESDILSYPPAMTTGDGSSSSSSSEGTYDLIVANACFGNFWNQTAVLAHCANRLRTGGSCVVSHPLGADFVARLHEEDPATVPHLLPTSVATWNDLTWTLPFQRTSFVHPTVPMADGTVVPFYACTLQKVRARALSHLVRLRGAVDAGYGRGGKQLGFPTANLPSRLFQTALVDVATGVYFGWAVLERDDNDNQNGGRNSTTTTTVHKAVVNVGYSPTFAGRENLEKIVEAHLMLEDDDNDLGDFYGATMRLLLTGYLRPEIKFPSLAALVAQIQQDVTEAKAALANEPHATLRSDPFLIDDGTTWVSASGGGDNVASWESQDIRSALDAVVVP